LELGLMVAVASVLIVAVEIEKWRKRASRLQRGA